MAALRAAIDCVEIADAARAEEILRGSRGGEKLMACHRITRFATRAVLALGRAVFTRAGDVSIGGWHAVSDRDPVLGVQRAEAPDQRRVLHGARLHGLGSRFPSSHPRSHQPRQLDRHAIEQAGNRITAQSSRRSRDRTWIRFERPDSNGSALNGRGPAAFVRGYT